jgi:DNA-binding MarR family transcriptional regulator
LPGMSRPGNVVRGEQHGTSVFKETDIRTMRALHQQGHTLKSIAIKYGTSSSYVSKIVNRKAWMHI